MRIVYLLLHDFRFASIDFEEFALRRFHFAKEYARRMADLGNDVKLYVLSTELSGTVKRRIDGYEIKGFKVSFLFPPLQRFGNSHAPDVLRELEKDAPDIVHFHNYYLWSFPYVALWVKRRGIPLVAQFHGTDPIRLLKGFGFYPMLRLCDEILVPTKKESEYLSGNLRLPKERIRLSPSTGVDTNLFHNDSPKDNGTTLLYVGRIPLPRTYMVEKAPQFVIPIFRQLRGRRPDARLIVAGDGPGLSGLEKQSQGLGNSIEFLGQVPQEKLPALYSRSRLTFVPIHMDEIGPYWGGTVQESLACGTPVAAFNDESPSLGNFGLLIPATGKEPAEMVDSALADQRWLESVENAGPKAVAKTCEWVTLIKNLFSEYGRLVGPSR